MLKIARGLKPFIDADADGISTYIDDKGDEYVRVKIGDEDFCIAAHDYVKGNEDEFKWNEAMRLMKQKGLTLPTKEQFEMHNKHLDEINNILKEIGGEPLMQELYWTSTEYGSNSAWLYNGDDDMLYYDYKWSDDYRVRPVLNLIKK